MSEDIYINEEDLGRAWVHANQWQWDELFGDPPPGFDEMPDWGDHPSKREFLSPKMRLIESLIGCVGTSRAWWLYYLGRSEAEWRKWYFTERFIEHGGASIAEMIKEAGT